jgi:hypothetical protein
MGFLLRIVGFGLLILGIYLVGENIFFTTNVYPYWTAVAVGIMAIFISSRAILNPTSLWQFFLSLICIASGYKMLTTGYLPF